MLKMPGTPISLVVAIGMSCLAVVSPTFDFDLYWHLAFGREIWNTGTIIQQDVFSFTAAGTPFTNRYWLSQWLFYGLQHLFGWNALPILKLLITAGIAILMFRTALFLNARAWVAGILVPFCILLAHYRFVERPELFSLLFIAALAYLLTGWRTGHLNERALWIIPLLMLLWDWLHGGIFGLVYLSVFVIVENVLPSHQRRLFGPLNRIWLITLLVMLLNPLGLSTYGEFFSHLQGMGNPGSVLNAEYQPISWREFKPFILILLLWGALTIVLRPAVSQSVATLLFVLLSTQITRMTGVAMILVAPLLAVGISLLLERPGNMQRLGQILMITICLGWIVEGYTEKFRQPYTPRSFGWGVAENALPAGAARMTRDLNLQGNFFNSGHFGGYLAWELYPERRVFHYNNGNIFGDTYRYWDKPALLAQYNIQYAFVGNRQDLANFPPQEWAQIYREPAGALVIKRTLDNARLIEQLEVIRFNPNLKEAELRQLAKFDRVRTLDEIAIYLAYRKDERIAVLFNSLTKEHHGQLRQIKIDTYLAKAIVTNPVLSGFAMPE